MSALSIQPTYPIFTDIDGQPLEDGYLWIGAANLDPQVNPITVYWDEALTITAAQPIRTLAGYPSNSGTPARLYVNSDYSIRVMNKKGSAIYSAANATERYSSAVVDVTLASLDFLQSGTGAVTRTALSKMRDAVSPLDFGADPSGGADSTTALQNAIATGRSIDLGGYQNTFLISAPLSLAVGQCLFGEGATLKSNTNAAMVVMANNCRVTGIKFLGNNGIGSSQRAIFIDGGSNYDAVSRTQVDNCQFKNLGGSAYYVYRIVDAHQGNIFANNTVTGCVIGVDIAERGEYTSVTGNNIDQCGTGIKIVGGNTNVVGGVVSNCGIGILLGAGANDAHGSVSSVLINHSTSYSIKVDSITVPEFRFIGCTMYYGDLWIRHSSGVLFDSCVFGSIANFYFEQAIDNYFVSPRFIGNMPTFNNRFNGTESCTHYVNSITMGLSAGSSAPDINGGYISVLFSDPAHQSLLAGTSVVAFDTLEYNAITNDLGFTYLEFYDFANNKFENLTALKSPNKNFFADVEIAISIGGASTTVDYSKINVYLREVGTNRIVANFVPSAENFGSNPGTSWKIYSLTGRVQQNTYQVIVQNNTGVTLTGFRDQGATIPFKAKFTAF